ncbi:MAG: HAMP domain-containing histidine kinase, partial [Desulfuromonadales bacterium]|nr:HAMP domain-containing histidine kinase [Desulfuromonadales bacterium]
DLLPMYEELIQLFSFGEHRGRIKVDCPAEIEPVIADRELLFQAMENLLSNALKYAEEGPVTLGARDTDDSVLLWVSDSGPGIPAAAQGQIFNRFFRIDTHDGRRVGG